MEYTVINELDQALEIAPGFDSRWWIVMHPAMESLMRDKWQAWKSENGIFIDFASQTRIFFRNLWVTPALEPSKVYLCTNEEMDELLKDNKEWEKYRAQGR